MHFNLYNVILIAIICLIYSIAYSWAKNDCNDLLASITNCRANVVLANATKNNEEEQIRPGILGFLSKDPYLSSLSTQFDNNDKAIDVLKSSISSTEVKENKTKLGNRKENGFENPDRQYTNTGNMFYNKIATNSGNLSLINPMEKEKSLTIANIPQLNKEDAIDILKNTAVAFPAEKSEEQAADKEYWANANTIKLTRPAISKDFGELSNKTQIKTEKPTSSSEINFSEITNLSLDTAEAATLGQKVNFQRSSKDLYEGKENPVGKEILQNISTVCGYLLGKRISFAEPTTLMEFPWTALLLYNTNIRYHCGGSLITKKYVLTAAHCVAQEFFELTGVRLGEYDISEPRDCAPDVGGSKICATTVDVDVVKIIVHHDYSHLSFKNDIALLRLDNEYFGRSFYPICLPTPDMTYGGNTATVAGWGATEKAIRSSLLLKATIPIFDISKCSEIYRYNVFNDSTEICASGANEVDVCKGDSGGAIFYSHTVQRKDTYFQLGIISLGVRRCGDKRFLPAVFTKLNAFYKWIEHNLEY